jgi:predicted methyltransferase
VREPDWAAGIRDFERAGFRFLASTDTLRNTADDRAGGVFEPAIRGRTDRFVLVFERPVSAP